MPTCRLRKVLRRLEAMGASLERQGGRKHATIRYRGRVARWPNPHDDPIDDYTLNLILKELGISRKEYFSRES